MGSSNGYDTLNNGFHVTSSTVGIVANVLLLFAIKKRGNKAIQTYSILLMNTTVVDLIATIVGFFTTARVVSNHLMSITYLIFTGPCSNIGATICKIFYGCIHALLIIMHAYQRYKTKCIRHPIIFFVLLLPFASSPSTATSLTRKRNVIAISLLIHCSNLSIGFAVFSLLSDNNSDMDEFVGFYPQYRIMIEAGFALGAVHYSSVKSFLTAMFIVLSSPIVFTAAFFLRSRTLRALSKTSLLMSSSTKEIHRMFVRTLNFQLALTTFVGIGSGIYFFNLMGLIDHPFSEIAPCSIANLLPSVAPIFNLWCIRPYRSFVNNG